MRLTQQEIYSDDQLLKHMFLRESMWIKYRTSGSPVVIFLYSCFMDPQQNSVYVRRKKKECIRKFCDL